MLLPPIAARQLLTRITCRRGWLGLVGWIIVFSLGVVHLSALAPADLSRDLASASAGMPEATGTDRANPAAEAAGDLEPVASETSCARPADLPGKVRSAVRYSSRTVPPRERPPSRDRSRA